MKKFQSVLDSGLGLLDKLQDGGIREVMSMEDTIQPSSRNANEARLFAIEASASQEAEPSGRPRPGAMQALSVPGPYTRSMAISASSKRTTNR